MRTHFATVDPANESDNHDYWSEPICGTYTETLSDKWELVTCKRCLKIKQKEDQFIDPASLPEDPYKQ